MNTCTAFLLGGGRYISIRTYIRTYEGGHISIRIYKGGHISIRTYKGGDIGIRIYKGGHISIRTYKFFSRGKGRGSNMGSHENNRVSNKFVTCMTGFL